MLKEGARIRRIAGHFDGGMHDWPSEEEQNGEIAKKSGRFAQLRGHWASVPESTLRHRWQVETDSRFGHALLSS